MNNEILDKELKPSSIVKLTCSSGNAIISTNSNLIIGSKNGELLKVTNSFGRICESDMKTTEASSIQDLSSDINGNIFIAGEDGKIYQYSKDLQFINILEGHIESVCKLSYDKFQHRLFSASEDGTIIEWNLHSNTCKKLYSHDYAILALDYNPELNCLASSCADSTIKYYSVSNKKLLNEKSLEAKVWSLRIVNQKNFLIVGNHTGSLIFFDLRDFNEFLNVQIHDSRINSLYLCDSQNYAISTSFDQTIKVFDLNNKKVKYVLNGNEDWVRSVTINEDDSKIFGVGDDGYLRMWECSLKETHGSELLFQIIRCLWKIIYCIIYYTCCCFCCIKIPVFIYKSIKDKGYWHIWYRITKICLRRKSPIHSI